MSDYAPDFHASVFIRGPNARTVLIKDETKKEPLWKFPGGKNEGDEDPFETGIWETDEETGLIIKRESMVLVSTQILPTHTRYFLTASIDSFEGLVPLSKERERAAIFEIEELHKMVDIHPTYYKFFLEAGGA